MFKFLEENWDMMLLGVIGFAGAILGRVHEDKRLDRRDERADKAKVIYETHCKKEE